MMQDDSIDLEFQLSREDMRDAVFWVSQDVGQSGGLARQVVTMVGVAGGAGAVVFAVTSFLIPSIHPALATFFFFVGALAAFVAINISFARQVSAIVDAQMRLDGGVMQMHFDADGLTLKTEHLASRMMWSAVDEIAVIRDRLIVLRMGAVAHLIPTGAVPDGMSSAVLVERLNQWKTA
ncbi:hypothetical protein [Roseovarius sp. 2305UL8-3]|uniref:hypothetical protein n=1 Tax=Roseovarius conchicola TaxID=3121636 RepID=UPI003526E001